MTIASHSRLLLISNSTQFGRGYLDHVEAEIREFLGEIRRVLFIPFALFDRDGYAAKARERFQRMGLELDSVHAAKDKSQAIETAEAIFTGGGNTFRLLKTLYDLELLDTIRARSESGVPYLGASAGSNIAGPTIRTTNDMPIVQPPSFDALSLVPFQINPHYLDPVPNLQHMGETREQRLIEFLEENESPVVAMREGAWLRVESGRVMLKGTTGARIFRRGTPATELRPGTELQL